MACDPCEWALPGLAGLQAYVAGQSAAGLARERGFKREEIAALASNENPLSCSPEVARLWSSADRPDWARYPEEETVQLRNALAEFLQVDADCLTLGNGSNELLELVARAYVEPGREILYSQYGFAVYPLLAKLLRAEGTQVPARQYAHDLDALAAAVTERTRLVFLANPNNPTGTWFGAAALRDFLRAVPERLPVVLDEAYHEYAVASPRVSDWPDALGLLREFPNLIVTRTFSKAYGLAGLRVGYAVSDPRVAGLLNRVRQPFNVNCMAAYAARHALADQEHLRRSLRVNEQGMRQLEAALSERGLPFLPSPANFLLIELLPRKGQEISEALLSEGVIVRPVDNYRLPSHLRVSVGTEKENQRFITALDKALGQ